MRVLVLVVLFLLVGCVSEETKQLAQGVHLTQLRQEEAIMRFFGTGEMTREEVRRIVRDQGALTRATKALSEILGEPKASVVLPEGGAP